MKVLNTPEPSPAQFASEETSVAVCGALYVRTQHSNKRVNCASSVELVSSDLQAQLADFKFSLDLGWTCVVCGAFNSVAYLRSAYDLSLEQMILEVIYSRAPGAVIPFTEKALRALLENWRTSDLYVDGPTMGQRDGIHWVAQRLSRRAIAQGLDPAMVHDLIRHHPTSDIDDVFKTVTALERATPNQSST